MELECLLSGLPLQWSRNDFRIGHRSNGTGRSSVMGKDEMEQAVFQFGFLFELYGDIFSVGYRC